MGLGGEQTGPQQRDFQCNSNVSFAQQPMHVAPWEAGWQYDGSRVVCSHFLFLSLPHGTRREKGEGKKEEKSIRPAGLVAACVEGEAVGEDPGMVIAVWHQGVTPCRPASEKL